MRRPRRAILAAALLAAGCSSSGGAGGASGASGTGLSGTVVVFAAASLKATFTALAASFEQAHPSVLVVSSFGGSDSLATQIVQGAPVDVYAAADTTTMASVTRAHDAEPPIDFARNSLEIAVYPGNPKHITGLADLAGSGVTLALCAATVPCGAAAGAAFRAASLTPHPVTLEPDVASVLTKVELGEVDAGLVYTTDVRAAAGKVTGVAFPEATSAVNTYPIAVVTTGKNSLAGQAFVDYVLSSAGQEVLRDAGFQQP